MFTHHISPSIEGLAVWYARGLRRTVASLTVPGGQEFHFPHFFLKYRSIFPQTLLIFFLILALRVGDSPTREGPGYATGVAPLTFARHISPLIWLEYSQVHATKTNDKTMPMRDHIDRCRRKWRRGCWPSTCLRRGIESYILLNAAVNGKLELTLLKGRQRFDTVSTSNLKV